MYIPVTLSLHAYEHIIFFSPFLYQLITCPVTLAPEMRYLAIWSWQKSTQKLMVILFFFMRGWVIESAKDAYTGNPLSLLKKHGKSDIYIYIYTHTHAIVRVFVYPQPSLEYADYILCCWVRTHPQKMCCPAYDTKLHLVFRLLFCFSGEYGVIPFIAITLRFTMIIIVFNVFFYENMIIHVVKDIEKIWIILVSTRPFVQ